MLGMHAPKNQSQHTFFKTPCIPSEKEKVTLQLNLVIKTTNSVSTFKMMVGFIFLCGNKHRDSFTATLNPLVQKLFFFIVLPH